jgi:hypothetical protein
MTPPNKSRTHLAARPAESKTVGISLLQTREAIGCYTDRPRNSFVAATRELFDIIGQTARGQLGRSAPCLLL